MENTAANSYNVSIRISPDGFSLLICDESGLQLSTKRITAPIFNLTAEEIGRLIADETQFNYREVRIICESDVYIFVPMPLFRPEESSYYLNFQHKIQKRDLIIFNTIRPWNTVNVFTIPTALFQALSELFPDQIIEHHMSAFLTDRIKPQQEDSINIWARPQMADLIVVKDSKLQLLNSYSYQTAEDFSYHALNTLEQLSLDAGKCRFFLHNADKKPELGKLLGNYVTVVG